MADLKYRRLMELNSRLKEDLDRPRVKVSEAALSLINYCNNTRDFMVPSTSERIHTRQRKAAAAVPSCNGDNDSHGTDVPVNASLSFLQLHGCGVHRFIA
ncbi:hypothetical protein VTN49DRAFT_4605 [Thermomyces lanuginosus]|uniref:uncharacterized protein n=1 Tax=Thermomyces lanuginosus TaxID=5541 RepID=UPI0037427B5B